MQTTLQSEAPEWFTAALAETPTEHTVNVHGCDIAVRRWGSSSDPGVLLVHGGGGHGRWWDHVAPFLAIANAVATIDLSGHGDSGRRDAYRWALWGDEIAAVAAELALLDCPPVVVAHSMGARATVKAAATVGDAIRGMILVDSSVGTVWPEKERLLSRPTPPKVYPSEEAILERFRLRPAQEHMLPYVFEHIARTSIRQVADGWTWKVDPNTRDRDGDIGPETLVQATCEIAYVRGERGRVTPYAAAQLGDLLGRPVPVIEIPRAHHHVMVDEPLSLVTALRGCLALWGHVGVREEA